ncbi:MAG: NUDIX domain-containing protein, partial [Candidatus Heimdallarchaeaceae archaeon]
MKEVYIYNYDTHRIGVGGLCFKGEEVLLVKQTYGLSKGMWTLPGGLVELGEILSRALTREVFEETAVMTEIDRIIFIRHMINKKENEKPVSDLYLVFLLNYIEGEPRGDG